MLVAAECPELIAEVGDELAALRRDSRPHVRQSASIAKEMMVIVQCTQERLSDPADAERWYEILEWATCRWRRYSSRFRTSRDSGPLLCGLAPDSAPVEAALPQAFSRTLSAPLVSPGTERIFGISQTGLGRIHDGC